MWDRICEFAGGTALTTPGLVLNIAAIACIVFGFVTWFLVPATDRTHLKVRPIWTQRTAFERAKHYHLFLAGSTALAAGCLLALIAEFV